MADPDPLASSARIPDAIAVSLTVDGLKMNARSFEYPSPLMSPATTCVYGVPDRNDWYQPR